MRRATALVAAGNWPKGEERARVTLDWDHRHRRRIALAADDGGEFLLDLAETAVLRDGDGLRLEDGSWLAVRAKAEALCEIRASGPDHLARLAWHLGNRHWPVEIVPGALRIREDHVIVAMLAGLGASITHLRAPFTPETGAYALSHDHR